MTPQPSEQPTPWTKAGKALLDLLYEEDSSFTAREVLHAILAIEAEAAAPDPVASPDHTAARDKLATILHQRESAGKARCGANSRGCRMRHRMDASSILMELTKEN